MRYTHWPIWYYNLDVKQLFGGKRRYVIQVYQHWNLRALMFCGCKVNSNGTISVDKLLKFMKELEE